MSQTRIRDATTLDIPALASILTHGSMIVGAETEKLSEFYGYREALKEICASDRSRVLVAERQFEVVGMLQVFGFRHLQHRGSMCAEIESIYVNPDYHNEGIGGQLILAAIQQAKEWGCYRLQLTSARSRVDAHRFFVKQGFVGSHIGFKLWLETT